MAPTRLANCWDYQKCSVSEECPAYPNRGWECWNVEGTLCRGEKQGAYQDKIERCRQSCRFYDAMMTGRVA